jgi:nitroimidazol reductase NimA-like FMN-containing flavoprotein (pyridoxamine 5'-phosphate oxidase superfamily)
MSDALAALQERTFAGATQTTARSYPPERRLTAGQLTRYLDGHVFAVVATARPDGRPHAAVSSYVRSGAVFWLPTARDSVRERNVRSQPWTSLAISHGERDGHVVVIIEGPATVAPAADVPAEVRSRAGGDWASTWLRLQPERLISYASEGAL